MSIYMPRSVCLEQMTIIDLPENWLYKIRQVWAGQDGLVMVLDGFESFAVKLLFESAFFTEQMMAKVHELYPSLQSNSNHPAYDDEVSAALVRKRITAQVALYDYLQSNPCSGLSALKIEGCITCGGKLVGYFMPRIDFPAININSNEYLKHRVLLFEAQSGFSIDRFGNNAFDLGDNNYILIDVRVME